MTFTSFVLFILLAGSSILTAENPVSEKVPFKSNPEGNDSNDSKIASEKNKINLKQNRKHRNILGKTLPQGLQEVEILPTGLLGASQTL